MRRTKAVKEKENAKNSEKKKGSGDDELEKDFLNQFTGKEKIGEGTYGVVYRVCDFFPSFSLLSFPDLLLGTQSRDKRNNCHQKNTP